MSPIYLVTQRASKLPNPFLVIRCGLHGSSQLSASPVQAEFFQEW